MSEKTKVSIVIPCYNVECYIKECLNSVINQTYKDLEIICINDGSIDSTLNILNEFQKADKRIKIISQENKGLSEARNVGIKNAKGEYITFIDSDDWINSNYIQSLYEAISENDCDIAAATIIRKRKFSEKYRVNYTKQKIYSTLEDKIKICNIPTCCYVWNKLYRLEKIKNIAFVKNVYFEDILWTPEVLKNTGKLITVPDSVYFYRVNKSSIVKKISEKKQNDSYNAKKSIIKFFEENNLELPEKHKNLTKKLIFLKNILLFKIKEYKNIEKYYLFGFIPLFSKTCNKTGRQTIKFLGIKFLIDKNKMSKKDIIKKNIEYEKLNENLVYPKVKDSNTTLDELINSNKSISRYGDGEFNIINGESIPFQEYSEKMQTKLKEILVSKKDNILITIPDIFASLNVYNKEAKSFWRKYISLNRENLYKILSLDKQYYSSEVSRPYIDLEDKSRVKEYFNKFKKVWDDKNIIIVEGMASRLGVQNNLFDNVKSIKRIICPIKNAYNQYDEILKASLKQSKDDLFIIALGPTATILAYDLSEKGYRALDLGHIDIEYEWFLRGAKKKVAIKNKYVNEVKNGKAPCDIDDKKYQEEIIEIIK